MDSGAWVPGESDEEGLPDFDVRAAVLSLPAGPLALEDFPWVETPNSAERLPVIRSFLHRLSDGDAEVAHQALTDLRYEICNEGYTSVDASYTVPTLLRAALHTSEFVRVWALQLVGDLGRCRIYYDLSRRALLRMMAPGPVIDAWGYLENWAVEAVRMMIGRDIDLLSVLLNDDNPLVRGRAAYVLAAALSAAPLSVELLRARLATEADPGVQATLIISIAEHELDKGRAATALAWTESLWTDSASPPGVRLGATISWLGLTSAPTPPALTSLIAQLSTPSTYDLLGQLPWVSWMLSDELIAWWQKFSGDMS
jgi:hypothetical protein